MIILKGQRCFFRLTFMRYLNVNVSLDFMRVFATEVRLFPVN